METMNQRLCDNCLCDCKKLQGDAVNNEELFGCGDFEYIDDPKICGIVITLDDVLAMQENEKEVKG